MRTWSQALICQRLETLPGTSEIVVHAGQLDDPTFPGGVAYQPARRVAETRFLEALFPLLRDGCCPTHH